MYPSIWAAAMIGSGSPAAAMAANHRQDSGIMNMIVEVQHIPIEGKSFEYIKKADSFAVLRSLVKKGECRFPDPLVIELTVVPERNLIRVEGMITITIELSCSRCLAEFKNHLKRRFTLRFSRESADETHTAGEKEIEVTDAYVGLTFFTGESIDFTDTVQEQVVLALPYKPLCRETCKGLCPRCGTDLNAGPCGCTVDDSRNPFAVLKNLSWPAKSQEKH
jgi:DUF177 domain-containing protein